MKNEIEWVPLDLLIRVTCQKCLDSFLFDLSMDDTKECYTCKTKYTSKVKIEIKELNENRITR